MTRSTERWTTFARAAARRFAMQVKRVLTVDPDVVLERDEAELAAARELARSGGDLKGGMAKLAQLMAYHVGPGAAEDAEARRALGQLWDCVPGEESEAIRRVVVEDLGQPPEALFASWDPQPFAAASLGQVHAAVGHDGAKLAVKVQYPGVAESLRADLDSRLVMKRLVGGELGGGITREAIDTLRDGILGELDYVAEGQRMMQFRAAFADDPAMVLPRRHAKLSSARVLTMDRLEGRSLDDLARTGSPEERARVALVLFRFAWGAPLRHGLVNADPNPGNYLVLGDGKVGFLDFGCALDLDERLVDLERRLWRAVLKLDGETLRHSVAQEGLLARALTLDSDAFRAWEKALCAPFLVENEFDWTPDHARELARLTAELVLGGGMTIPAKALLLWRQRLGVTSVIASLAPRANFRRALVEVTRDLPPPGIAVVRG